MAFGVLTLVAIVMELGAATLLLTNGSVTRARRQESRAILLHLADAGLQAETDAFFQSFRISQSFTAMDSATSEASYTTPKATLNGQMEANQRFSASVISVTSPDSFTRDLVILSVGWIDSNNDGALDSGELRRAVRSTMRFSLSRAEVFDYAYFVNNYGWMQGFGPGDMIVNGDMRANGNFDFSGGTPTINGSVYAAPNDRLLPAASGVVNITPTQWGNSYYETNANSRSRQAYNVSKHGAKGGAQYDSWKDLIYDRDAYVKDDDVSGSVVGDRNGTRTYGGTVLSPESTSTLTMPDLSDLSRYMGLSNDYVDTKQTFGDGSANPGYGEGAYVDVWNSTTSQYDRISTNGVVTGNAALIGTSDHPIKIHGPVTITQDAIIKGTVDGQGTIYTGRNVHIVGSITYKNPPDFRGSDPTTIDNNNEKKSVLGLAARASIIMGDTSTFGYYPLAYMSPPFTHARYDDNGNLIPAYNAYDVDSYSVMKYQSVLGSSYIHSVSSSISQIDAVLYTNFLGGGNIGTGGGGVTFNGSIISRDEAMVLWSLPFRMNYDNRIKERALTGSPLIDIDLPRSPTVTQLNWQEVNV
jgi:hypothetical protein